MGGTDEYTPNWESVKINEGWYIWNIYVVDCQFKDLEKEKPYMRIDAQVEDPPNGKSEQAGFEFDFRVYISKKSQGWAQYFLKKFGYNEELLQIRPGPKLLRSEVKGLHGKILVNLALDNFQMLRVDVKGFDHCDGTELETKIEKEKQKAEKAEADATQSEQPAVDVNDDVKNVGSSPEDLDNL